MQQTSPSQLTLFAEDTRANRSLLPGSEEARKMTAISGRNIYDSYKRFVPNGSLPKMLLATSTWASTKCFLTWRVRATNGGRLLFRLAVLMPRIEETGCGLWATPNAADCQGSHGGGQGRSLRTDVKLWPTPKSQPSGPDYARMNREGSGGDDLATAVARLLPTPTATDAIKGGKVSPRPGAMGLSETTGGQLNPTWVEWLMGYPAGWTDLEDSEMP